MRKAVSENCLGTREGIVTNARRIDEVRHAIIQI